MFKNFVSYVILPFFIYRVYLVVRAKMVHRRFMRIRRTQTAS